MKMVRALLIAILLLSAANVGAEQQFISNIKVVQIGAYQHSPGHFVWFSIALPGCASTPSFDESRPGGKALLTLLTTALVGGRKVDVRYQACDITEIYLK
jgi:hypothetical protein